MSVSVPARRQVQHIAQKLVRQGTQEVRANNNGVCSFQHICREVSGEFGGQQRAAVQRRDTNSTLWVGMRTFVTEATNIPEEKSVFLISSRLGSCCGDVVGLVIEFLSISDIQGPTIVDLDEGGVLGGKLCLVLTSLTRSRAR